ncbi:DUF2937 family protein [Aquisalinus flavus]|uniref:DUF2937 family protein n=1 Tax=Aquisalinus flavus TaxID=1526572 RepID=A0A8J2V6S3_9PROT|nr:DUF2937 family protein [Aquisalinus flavus]MBD0426792.1 DUF2937 family protein [Aquisalinus flavus]UNE46643.1 DUF2937 family protein [Aquisalinus flavus]GGC96050.1 hypothetical protein GCM10011342_01040 [Aquisalinus flavus]
MGKFLALVIGIAGGLLGSQAPGFTLQYMQDLSGRVAQLKDLVEEFDAGIARYGYTRDQALRECTDADGLLDALCDGYEVTVRDYLDLSTHLEELRATSDYERPILLARTYRENIVDSVMEEFKPAVPTTADGAAYAGGGLAGFWAIFSGIWALITAPFRRRAEA